MGRADDDMGPAVDTWAIMSGGLSGFAVAKDNNWRVAAAKSRMQALQHSEENDSTNRDSCRVSGTESYSRYAVAVAHEQVLIRHVYTFEHHNDEQQHVVTPPPTRVRTRTMVRVLEYELEYTCTYLVHVYVLVYVRVHVYTCSGTHWVLEYTG